jgi:hypothetical protein
MSETPRLIYTPRHGVTPATELSALVACYRFLLSHARKEGAGAGAPDDAERRSSDGAAQKYTK